MPPHQGGKKFAPIRPLLNQPPLNIDDLPHRIHRGDCNVLPTKFCPPQCVSAPPPCTPMCLPPCTPYGQPCMPQPQPCMPQPQPCMQNCYYPCLPPPPPMCPQPCPPVMVCPPSYCTPYPSMPPPQCCPPPPCPPPPCQPCVPRCCTAARPTCCGNSGGCGTQKSSCCARKCCGGPKQIVCLPKGTKPIVGCGVTSGNTAMKKTCQSLGAAKPTIGDQPASYNNCNFYLSEIPKALKDRFGISMGMGDSSCEDTEETEEATEESSCADLEEECIGGHGINRAAGDDQVVNPPVGYPGSGRGGAWGTDNCIDGAGGGANGYPYGNGMGGPNMYGNGWGTAGGPYGRGGPGGGPYGRGGPGGGNRGRGRGGPHNRGNGRGGHGGNGRGGPGGNGRGGPGGRGRGGHGGPNSGYGNGRDGNGDPYSRSGMGGGNDPYSRDGTTRDGHGDPYSRSGLTRDGRSGGVSNKTGGRGRDLGRESGKSNRSNATSAAFSQLSGYRDHHYSHSELTGRADSYIPEKYVAPLPRSTNPKIHPMKAPVTPYRSMHEQGISDVVEGDEAFYDQPYYGSSIHNHGTSGRGTPNVYPSEDIYGDKRTQTSHYQGGAHTGDGGEWDDRGDSGYRTGGNMSINTHRGNSEPALNSTPRRGDIPVYRTSTQTQLKIIERHDDDPEIHVVQRPVQEVIGYQQDPSTQGYDKQISIADSGE
ncbi:unnamed protein product [Orchesella dallaii]|uniref:Uncharacterized protein n=1 Tax=Orchesella dallaii TaxID=48710 RepID=A0ABP1RDN3_9HEXA